LVINFAWLKLFGVLILVVGHSVYKKLSSNTPRVCLDIKWWELPDVMEAGNDDDSWAKTLQVA
jgi:hypothetical protein